MKLSPSSAQKIKTYVGFACKARKCVLGVDNIIKDNKPMLVLYSSELAENSVKKTLESTKAHSQRAEKIEDFNLITPKIGCKAVGIKDINLAEAIIKQLNI